MPPGRTIVRVGLIAGGVLVLVAMVPTLADWFLRTAVTSAARKNGAPAT